MHEQAPGLHEDPCEAAALACAVEPDAQAQRRIVPVILAGGSGTRLWPLSRDTAPKQLLPLVGERTLLQDTVLRAALASSVAPIVVCGEALLDPIGRQLDALGRDAHLLVEPVGRNTAAAIAVAALRAMADDPRPPVLLVMPADHAILGRRALRRAFADAVALADAGFLVTFGVPPTRAETGYGYLRCGSTLADGRGRLLAAFVEKPDRERAAAFCASGDHLWNCGMFAFRADVLLREMRRCEPALLDACVEALARGQGLERGHLLDARAFAAAPSVSIDVAVMERTRLGAVVPLDARWSDIGAWDAVWAVGEGDARGNVATGDVLLEDCEGCYVRGGDRLVAAVGLRDTVIVDTGDALLVAPLERAQDVKAVVARLRADARPEVVAPTLVQRPWGSYEVLARGKDHQMKRLVVEPGGRLSLQRHRYRAEHWIVVGGVARVTCDDAHLQLDAGESTFIPCGAVHRLENPGPEPLVVLEVQMGCYLGEDDIERLDDDYGRAAPSPVATTDVDGAACALRA
jgi:mannose-1-phosphate guanylyltransferase/mannose-6-phosphate isomerase